MTFFCFIVKLDAVSSPTYVDFIVNYLS